MLIKRRAFVVVGVVEISKWKKSNLGEDVVIIFKQTRTNGLELQLKNNKVLNKNCFTVCLVG